MWEDLLEVLGFDFDDADDAEDLFDDDYEDEDADWADEYQQHLEQLNPEQAAASSRYMVDNDGDGYDETFINETLYDTDGDGYVDTVKTTQEIDANGDGLADYSAIRLEHINAEGEYHLYALEDMNGNGTFETVSLGLDGDDDGNFENVYYHSALEDAYTPFDAENADMDAVVGNPLDAADSWHQQETGSSCAIASPEFVLEQFFDHDFTESELRDLAEENGWYTPGGGTPMNDVGNILEHFGLNVERSVNNSLEDLEKCLSEGGQVIVGIDADELWEGSSDDFYGPGMGANHAIQVIGVDHTEPDNPMVIINDSGTESGQCAAIPAELFMDAWEDSGNFMVTAFEA